MTTSPEKMRLGDLVEVGKLQDLQRHLVGLHEHFRSTCRWITANKERTDRTLALFNLLSAASAYLHVAAHNLQTHASVLALATRSLFELNLRARHLLISNENMQSWKSEALHDKAEVLKGILGLDTVNAAEHERAVLRAEIERLESLAKRYDLPTIKRIPTTAAIADSVGRRDEYNSFFKLFSKIVHPSSYLVNDYDNAASSEVSMILQFHAQLYAWDMFTRVCDALEVPDELRTPVDTAKGTP